MKINFLGTNGWYTSQTGNTPCILIDCKEGYIIFDAGNGFYKIGQYIKKDKPIFLFISHFHLDHISGLHTLGKFNFSQGIEVYVGHGRKKDFETLVNPPFTQGFIPKPENIINLQMPVRLHELSEGEHKIPFMIKIVEQVHGYRDHGFRLTLEGKIVCYSGDCGESKASYKLAENCDLLIHECSYITDNPRDPKGLWGHVKAEQAAQIAKKSGAKKLILTHFDPTKYPTLESRKEAEKRAQQIFPETKAATDGLTLTI